MKRRSFLSLSAGASLTLGSRLTIHPENLCSSPVQGQLSRVEAKFYRKLPDREIECQLCPRLCKLGDKERGYCGVRENQGGRYVTLVYGKVCALHSDPIEKKPLYHFTPGVRALSIASAGCNVNCKFCQNWEISQVRPEQIRHIDLPPEKVVETAVKYNCPVIAYTYSEPVVFYEYMFDTAGSARKQGIRNVVITGGHINPDPLKELLKVVDAVKVDLKAFNQKFYTQYVRGELKPVLEAIQIIAESKVWLEIVYLVIPSINDDPDEIRKLAGWLKSKIRPDIPLHFSRFQPAYLMKNLPPTPVSTLETCRNIALEEGLQYVYIGNVPGHEAENTICPRCRHTLIKRSAFSIHGNEIRSGRCPRCRQTIPGIWD